MIEKSLTEAAWKKFADGRELQDAGLRKALAALAKVEKGPPDAQQKAVDEVDKQLEAVRKAHKSDKAVAGQLGELDKALKSQRKTFEEEARKAAQSQADDDDEEESPALLTTKMKSVLKDIQKGTPGHALIALAGKAQVVLVAKKSISPARRKLLTGELGTTSGVKFLPAQCLFEQGALTFVVESAAGGLAKRLKAALLEQTGIRYNKVRVRGSEPDDVDEEGDPEADALQAEFARVKKSIYGRLSEIVREGGPEKDRIVNLMGKSMKAEGDGDWQEALAIYGELEDLVGAPAPAPEPEPEADADDPKAVYDKLLAKLDPLLMDALKAQQGDVSKMRAVNQFAREKAGDGDYPAAVRALQTLAKLLGQDAGPSIPPAPPLPPSPPPPDPGKAFNARLAALMPAIQKALAAKTPESTDVKLKTSEAGLVARKKDFDAAHALLDEVEDLLGTGAGAGSGGGDFDEPAFRRRWSAAKEAWEASLDTVDAQIAKLQSVLKASDDPDLRQIAEFGLPALTGNHRTPLVAAMMEVDRASGENLDKAMRRAEAAAAAFENYLGSSDTVRVTDDNGFGVAVTIRESLGAALREMQKVLAA